MSAGAVRSAAAGAESRAGVARMPGAPTILAGMVALYAAVYSVACVLKYRALLYDDVDLAIFTEALFNLMHGSLTSSIRGASWLGDHSSLSLFLLAPFYAVARTPLTLLVAQSVALALGAIPVYRLARRELGDERLGLVFAALYLLYPALGFLNLFEFHPESFSTPALLAALAALREGRVRSTALWAALALLGKEDVALVVAALGLYALARRRPESAPQGLWLLGLAAASLALSFGVLKPALARGAPAYGAMYEQWGRTPGEIAAGIARAPWRAVAALFATPGDAHDALLKQQYWLQLLLPLGFLPLVAPEVLVLAIPIVGEHMLSWRTQQHTILYQYTALVIPVVVAAAVIGARRVAAASAPGAAAPPADRGSPATGAGARPGAPPSLAAEQRPLATAPPAPASPLRLAPLVLFAAIASQAMFGPLFGSGMLQAAKPPQRVWPTAADHARAAAERRLLARVPAGAGVVAGFELLASLVGRDTLHSLHHVVSGRYTFSSRMFPTPTGVAAMIADFGNARLAIYADSWTGTRLRAVVSANRLAPVEADGDLVLYLRDAAPGVTLVAPARCESSSAAPVFDRQLAFLGARLAVASVAAGGRLEFSTCWRRVAPADRQYLTEWLILDRTGRTVASRVRYLGYMIDPPADWPPAQAMEERYTLPLPPSLTPGRYRLAMAVGGERGGHALPAEASDPAIAAAGGVVPLGEFVVSTAPSR
jgi:uncharacterized membrane protein